MLNVNVPSALHLLLEFFFSLLGEEILLVFAEGVVAEPQDLDLCMILGAGWPFWLGGITPYLDREGISQSPFLPRGIASVPA